MAEVSENTIGVDFNEVLKPTTANVRTRRFKTGTIVKGNDGKTYQYAKAGGSIAANRTTANVTLTNGEYIATSTGGSGTTGTNAAVADDYLWVGL